MSYEYLVASVEVAGGQSAFARATGISQQRLSGILKRKGVLPGEFVLATEAAFGVSRHDLRLDLYPREAASLLPVHGTVAFDRPDKMKAVRS